MSFLIIFGTKIEFRKTMKRLRPLILSYFILITLQVFSYVPPLVNVNTFNNPKEVHFSLGFGTNGPEQSLSVSLPNQTYLFFNSSFSIDSMEIQEQYRKHLFLELGYGFQKDLGAYWKFITSGGYSYGQFGSRSLYDDDYFYSYNEYNAVSFATHRIFVSFNYGMKFKILEFYFGARVTMGDYFSTNIEDQIYLRGKASFEPNLTFKIGFPKIKFIGQVRQSVDVFNHFFGNNEIPGNSYISFGAELNINFSTKK
jgi:hypothetical protein